MSDRWVAMSLIGSTDRREDLLGCYRETRRARLVLLSGLVALLVNIAFVAVGMGAYGLTIPEVGRALLGRGDVTSRVVLRNVRLPRIAAAITVGWALGLTGLATQTLLRNPLASPFTPGISQGEAFGAAVAVVWLHAVR